METEGVQVKQIEGSPLAVLGSALAEVQVGRTTQLVKVTFTEMKYPGILGMDFLLPTGGNLDFQLKELQLSGERIKCTSIAGESFIGRVVVSRTTVIPSGHEAVVPGVLSRGKVDMAGLAVVEPLEGGGELAQKGLVLARSLVDMESDVIPLRLFNPGQEKRVARAGTTVSVVSQVEAQAISGDTEQTLEAKQGLPMYLHDLYSRGTANVEAKYHGEVRKCLANLQDFFSKGEHDIGRTDRVQHHIKTSDAPPVKERPRRHPYCNQEEIQKQVGDLLKRGVIEPSDSPWAANVVLVSKKDGTKCFCVDYRRLNAVTIKDAYPVPRIDETFDALSGAKWIMTLDLASGYWQVALDEDASQKSTFVVRNGLYRWRCVPFGLCNAPATFESGKADGKGHGWAAVGARVDWGDPPYDDVGS